MSAHAGFDLMDFEVLIPTVDGTEVAERVTIKVPFTRDPDTGDEILNPEAFGMIEATQRSRRAALHSAAKAW